MRIEARWLIKPAERELWARERWRCSSVRPWATLTVVTNNVSHFARIPNLRVADWMGG